MESLLERDMIQVFSGYCDGCSISSVLEAVLSSIVHLRKQLNADWKNPANSTYIEVVECRLDAWVLLGVCC
jgi:hypothetical protein